MGLFHSKPKEPHDDHEEFVFDQRRIYFDEFGNIRYGGPHAPLPDREAEKQKIMMAELNVDDVSIGISLISHGKLMLFLSENSWPNLVYCGFNVD